MKGLEVKCDGKCVWDWAFRGEMLAGNSAVGRPSGRGPQPHPWKRHRDQKDQMWMRQVLGKASLRRKPGHFSWYCRLQSNVPRATPALVMEC